MSARDTGAKPKAKTEPAARRKRIRAGAGAVLSGWLPAGLSVGAPAPEGQRPNAISGGEALRRLLDGNARYATNQANEKDFSSGRAARAAAQYPIAAILSCADSRVAPEFAFDQGAGDLFVVRVAGNVVGTHLLASIEYAVEFLGVPLVLVLGHTNCGAVDAAIKVLKNATALPGHLPELIRAIKPAVIIAEKMATGDLLESAVIENVRRSVAALKRAAPVLKRFHDEHRIVVAGGVYDLATGRIALT